MFLRPLIVIFFVPSIFYTIFQFKVGCCVCERNDVICIRSHNLDFSECSTIWLRLHCLSTTTPKHREADETAIASGFSTLQACSVHGYPKVQRRVIYFKLMPQPLMLSLQCLWVTHHREWISPTQNISKWQRPPQPSAIEIISTFITYTPDNE